MPVPNSMADLPTLAGSNSPAGTEAIGNSLDNYIRAHGAIIRSTNAIASASIASASVTDIATADGESVQITGTANIDSFGTGFAGCYRECRFSGALTIVNSANIQLPNAANITTAAGDALGFRCLSTGVWVLVNRARTLTADVITAIGYTPANRAGDLFTGNVGIQAVAALFQVRDTSSPAGGVGGSVELCASNNSGTQVVLGRVKAGLIDGTVGAEAGEVKVYTRVGGVVTLAATFDALQNLAVANGITGTSLTVGGGRKISQVVVSSSAPGTLADGVLYLRY